MSVRVTLCVCVCDVLDKHSPTTRFALVFPVASYPNVRPLALARPQRPHFRRGDGEVSAYIGCGERVERVTAVWERMYLFRVQYQVPASRAPCTLPIHANCAINEDDRGEEGEREREKDIHGESERDRKKERENTLRKQAALLVRYPSLYTKM